MLMSVVTSTFREHSPTSRPLTWPLRTHSSTSQQDLTDQSIPVSSSARVLDLLTTSSSDKTTAVAKSSSLRWQQIHPLTHQQILQVPLSSQLGCLKQRSDLHKDPWSVLSASLVLISSSLLTAPHNSSSSLLVMLQCPSLQHLRSQQASQHQPSSEC